MILVLLVMIPLAAGFLSWTAGRYSKDLPRWIALVSMGAALSISLALWTANMSDLNPFGPVTWIADVRAAWIPQFGIYVHLGLDGISLLLIVLTDLLGIMSVIASWTEIRERVGFFHFNLLFTLAGVTGVFLSLDLFLFAFFWELMLVPLYFLIALWGHEGRRHAAFKFFLFTQAGGLLMIVSILWLAVIHGRVTGSFTFEYTDLIGGSINPSDAMLLLFGFLAAFLVKLPAIPVHTWLPDAHTEAPTAGSVILAGLLLKTGAYGLIRFAVPLFPVAAQQLAPWGMALGVIGIVYGALLSFAQSDLKRLIAYTSISHMGFVLLGISAGTELALQGVMIQIICHGISTGALFMLAGALQERMHTRELARMGGLWERMPRMGGAGLFFTLASLGLPGMGNFIAEFLVLLGTFQVSATAAACAASGFVLSTAYALRMVRRIFFGRPREERIFADYSVKEMAPLAGMMAVIIWIGIYPQTLINTARPGLLNIMGTYEPGMKNAFSAGNHDSLVPRYSQQGTGEVFPTGRLKPRPASLYKSGDLDPVIFMKKKVPGKKDIKIIKKGMQP